MSCSILVISYSVLPSATNDICAPDLPLIGLTRADGHTVLLSAPTANVEAFVRERRDALDGAVARVSALGRETFAAGAARGFASAYGQLPVFADWAYSWIASYVFSYQIMYSVAKTGAGTLSSRDTLVPAVREATIATVAQEFNARVLVPSHIEEEVETAQEDARAVVRDELARFFQREREAWDRFASQSCPLPPVNAQPIRRIAIAGAFIPSDSDAPSAQTPIDSEVAKIFGFRALRPFGVRVAIPTLAAFGIGGSSGFGVGLVLGAGVAWTLDFVINSTDAALNRSKLDQLLVQRVQAEEARLAAEVAALLRAGLESGTADYRSMLATLAAPPAPARKTARESPILK